MFSAFQELGVKLTRFLGDPGCGTSGNSERSDAQFSSVPLSSLLPYEAFDESRELFIGQNSVGFVLEALPLVGGDEAIEKIVSSLFQELLDEGASLQCLLFADHRTDQFLSTWSKAREQASDALRELTRKREEYFRSSPGISPRLFRFILSYSVAGRDLETLEALKEKREKFLETLKPITYARGWRPEDLLELVGGLVNFSFDSQVTKRQWNPLQTLASQLTTGGTIEVGPNNLTWKGKDEVLFKSYRTVDLPSYWTLNSMQMLIGDVLRDAFRVQTPFYIHYGVHCPKQSSVESAFWRKAHLIENQGKSQVLVRWIPSLGKELQECDYIRGALHQGSRFVWTQLSAGLWADRARMSRSEQALKGLFRINQFLLAENRCVHLPQFIACLPLTWTEYVDDLKKLNLLRTTLNTECVNFVPFQGEWIGTETPQMLLVGRRGQVLNWCPFDNKVGNYNVIVVGRSGSGKSVFMQDLLLSGLSTGASVFILDVGRSYSKMCSILDGQEIEFSKQSRLCLNPFTHISLDDDDERDASFSLLKSVLSCMAAPNEGTTDFENALLEKAITAAWDRKKQEATITDVASWLNSCEDQRAKTLGTMLTPYTTNGVYAKHFEGRNNVSFDKAMVLIELEELKERKDLQAVILQLFIMAITQKAFLGDRTKPFFICIDEGWDLLRGKQSGPFIETLARRLRKYYGSLVVGTQSIEDFFATAGARAAFENSDWMCLLSQKSSSISALVESGKLDFDESKQRALESVTTQQGEFSEVMLCDAEGNYSIARLVLDPFSKLLYTTKAQEFAKIKELQAQGLSITQSIERILGGRRNHV